MVNINFIALLKLMSVEEFNELYIVRLCLIYPPLICTIDSTLSLCNTIRLSLIEDNSHNSQAC